MKKLWLILLSAAVITSCKNGGDDGGTIDPPGDNVVITVTETSVQNVYTVSANLEASAQLRWDLGNGSTETGNNVTAKYPFKGDYTITLTYKSPTTYETLTKTKSLTVATDNPNLVESLTPEGILLSGGLGMPDGKTWVLDSLTYGHLGTGQESSYEAGDWNAGEMDKKGEGYYNQSMTFKPDYGFTLKNNGITWGGGSASEAEMAARGAVKITDIDDEWTARKYTYTPGTDWKWQFVTEDGKNYINFANNTGFLIYFRPGPHKYEILTLNENELHVRQKAGNAGDGVALYMKFIREGFKRAPKKFKLVTDDNFEDGGFTEFMTDFMYPSYEEGVPREQVEIVDNPYPTANNNSSKVAKYVRNDQPWWALDRLLPEGESYDISQYAKITMKVYFPGAPTNDYTTQGGNIGEDWAPKTLQKSFVLRFRTGDDYLTDVGRTEDITDDKMDEWQYVEFDLSASVDKAGREKLTLQFGGEAHHNPGVFYFDDVKVYKLEEE